MTREIQVLLEAKKELDRATWAGQLEHGGFGHFDDSKTRDKFVIEQVGNTIKALELFIKKVRPAQNNKRIDRKKKTLFN